MSRYIDAEELYLDFQTDEEMRLWENLEYVRKTIEKQPAADVRENVHGEWEIFDTKVLDEETGETFKNIRCSRCKQTSFNEYWPLCPWCGAIMREVKYEH